MQPFYETRPDEIFAFTSIQPNCPPHLHIHLELFYVLSGKIQVTVDQNTQILSKGDLAVIFPNCVHQAVTQSNSDVMVAVIAMKPQLTGELNKIVLSFYPEKPFITFSSTTSKAIEHAINQLLESCANLNKYEYIDLIIKSYVQIILGFCIPELTLIKNTRPEYYLVQKSVNYILEHFSEPLSLESVANHFGVNTSHLSSAFSHKMHVGFNQYLNEVRLNYAQNLISSTNKSITQIAFDCGFGTLRTFNRVFEKYNKMTPSEYRNLQSKNFGLNPIISTNYAGKIDKSERP